MTHPVAAISPRHVIVAGDVVVDHHIYEGKRRKPDNAGVRGVRHVREAGGAAGIRELVDALAKEEADLHAAELRLAEEAKAQNLKPAEPRPAPEPIICALGIEAPDLAPLHAPHHAFAVWRPHKLTRAGKEERLVWRTDLALGYGHDPIAGWGGSTHTPTPLPSPKNPDVLVLDDAGSVFRKGAHRDCWHLSEGDDPRRILLKLSDPIAQGDLWRALVPARAERLVVAVAAEALRREEVRIGEQLSWEQTLENLAVELDRAVLKPLGQAADLIVTFGADAAVWISRSRPGKAHFAFDAAGAEGDFAAAHDGSAIGYMTCMAAALGYSLSQAAPGAQLDLGAAIESGLRGMRDLLLFGHGLCGAGVDQPQGFPKERLAAAMRRPAAAETDFSRLDIPWPPPASERGRWMIVESSQRPLGSNGPQSLVGLATEVLRRGSAAYGRLPYLKFASFVTAERGEIEALRGIRQLMRGYGTSKVDSRPLSIGVFGPPGAGKSFAVKEIATELFGQQAWLEFNLSQFTGAADLIGAFHQVRDRVLGGTIPVVFWDEFDSQDYQWLRSLLAPMQDGRFQEGQVTHPIGHAVFIFAGGTASRFSSFGVQERTDSKKAAETEETRERAEATGETEAHRQWRLSKGPDFKSRLDAYDDVTGPNRRHLSDKTEPGPADIGYPLRRALLIRGQLGYKKDEPLGVDADLARALLVAPDYTHGSRSLEKLVRPLAGDRSEPLRRSALPPRDQIAMHVDHEAFLRLLDRSTSFTNSAAIERLAKAIHGDWLEFKEEPGVTKSALFDREWEKLEEAGKEDNRAAARRIPAVLALAGLGVSENEDDDAPDAEILKAHLEHNMERLAEAEHDGWRDARERNGWQYASIRNDSELLHPLLLAYSALSEPTKEKDRGAICRYPEIVEKAGFRVVWLQGDAG